MTTKPHSREKKIVQKAIKVEKKKIDSRKRNNSTNNIVKNIFSSLIKK